jgi:hypothetical protein
MTSMRALALAAAAACLLAGRATAQTSSLPEGWHLLVTTADSTRVVIDSASVARSDGGYTVRTATLFPERVTTRDGTVVELEMDFERYDCTGGRIRSVLAQTFAEGAVTSVRTLGDRWERVPPSRAPLFQLVCAFLTQAFPQGAAAPD